MPNLEQIGQLLLSYAGVADLACLQRIVIERSEQIRGRRRSSERLRRALARADAECRAYCRVAAEYGVSWWLVNDVAVRAAAVVPLEPAPVRWLGIDESRTRRPRWLQDRDTGKWRREDPWMTSLTNLDPACWRAIDGLTPGRSSAAVCTWIEAREPACRDQIEVVAIDPCAAYAHVVRKVLPHAAVVVDHFHLDRLGNDMLTKVPRRVTWDNRDRRGRLVDPEWANRRRLLTARERLTPQRFAQMWNACNDGDPSGQIIAAYIAKEELRALLSLARRRPTREMISNAKYRFGAWCAMFANVPEILTLAETIDTWWPEIEAFLRLEHHQRPHRGLEQNDQAAQASRLRVRQPSQLLTPYPRLRDRTGRGVTGQINSAAHPEPPRALTGVATLSRHVGVEAAEMPPFYPTQRVES